MFDEASLPRPTSAAQTLAGLSGREATVARAAPQDLEQRQILDSVGARLFGDPGPIGRYTIRHKLGAGGMGVVYAAYDPVLDCEVALKQLHGYLMVEPGFLDRLKSEARAMARLRGEPHVVTLFDFFVQGEVVFVVMELVAGTTLRAFQADATRGAVLGKYLEAGLGLAAAHRAGLVHRDFKPENVLLDSRGVAKVSDFGLARIERSPGRTHDDLTAAASLTGKGLVVGTPRYMSPEQLADRPLDARSDQFSFCVALWEALFAGHPFYPIAGRRPEPHVDGRVETTLASRGTPAPVAFAHAIADGPLHAAPATTDVAPHVIRALTRGLRKAPDQRFPTMDALLAALRETPVRGHKLQVAGVAACLAAGLAFALPSPPEAPPPTRAQLEQQARDDLAARLDLAALRGDLLAARFPGAPHILGELERYSERWAAQQATQAFALQQRPGDHAAAARLRCLGGAREAALQLTAGLANPTATASMHAAELVDDLPSPEECSEMPLDWLQCSLDRETLASQPHARPVLTALADASTLEAAGDFPSAIASARTAVRSAETTKLPLLLGQANYHHGRLLYLEGRSDEAVTALLAARDAVESTGCIDLRADIYSRLIKVTAIYPSLPAGRAEEWTEVHRVLADAVPDAGTRVADALNERGLLTLLRRRDPRAALVDLERAARHREWLLGGRPSMDLADTFLNVAIAHRQLGEFDEASNALTEATRLRHEVGGPTHPLNYKELLERGLLQIDRGEFAEALKNLDRSLVLAESGFGHDSGPTARAALARASALVGLERSDDATAAARDAAARASAAAIDPTESFEMRSMALALAAQQGDLDAGARLRALAGELVPGTRVTPTAQAALRYMLAVVALERDANAEALDQADRSLDLLTAAGVHESSAEYIKVLRLRGVAAFYVDDLDGAIRDLERTLVLNGDQPASRFIDDRIVLASALQTRGRGDDVRRACDVLAPLATTPDIALAAMPDELRRICRVG